MGMHRTSESWVTGALSIPSKQPNLKKPPGTKWTPYKHFRDGQMNERVAQAQHDPMYHFMGNKANVIHPASVSSQIKDVLKRA